MVYAGMCIPEQQQTDRKTSLRRSCAYTRPPETSSRNRCKIPICPYFDFKAHLRQVYDYMVHLTYNGAESRKSAVECKIGALCAGYSGTVCRYRPEPEPIDRSRPARDPALQHVPITVDRPETPPEFRSSPPQVVPALPYT